MADENNSNPKNNEKDNNPKMVVAKNLFTHDIETEMKKSYLDYAMSVIVSRALPDVRDGFKPVHRRVLFSMNELSVYHDKPYKKSARIVGDCLGKYHPHGDVAVYNSLVRMAQSFSLRYPLIDGQGNLGSIDGDSPAAMRYTEARLAKISDEMLLDLNSDTVNFVDNFDGSLKEPEVLPAKLPNLLVNGSSGIAVGMATNIPPHNLTETCNAIKMCIDNPDTTVDEIFRVMKGPDFPTGGIIVGIAGIKTYYYSGKSKIKVRARAKVEEKKNRSRIIISEIPYQVNKSNLVIEIANLVKNKVIEGISDIRDESDREGIRIVIELKRETNPDIILNNLYKHSAMQTTFGVELLALSDNVPKRHSLKELIFSYISHRKNVITRKLNFELNKNRSRLHILEGLIKALSKLDESIKIIKAAADTAAAREALISFLDISEKQANAILDLKLQKLTSLEQSKINNEANALTKRVNEILEILSDGSKILNIIKSELDELITKYGDERRTEILMQEDSDFDVEELIDEEDNVVIITESGYIKRMELTEYRTQNRGGRGVTGVSMKDEDEVKDIFKASTLDYILFFSNFGKVYWKKIYQLPLGSRQSKGKAIINLIRLDKGESITSTICLREFSKDKFVFFATRKGVVKRTSLDKFGNPRSGGIIAITLNEGDELINTFITPGDANILIATKNGFAVKFFEQNVRSMGRSAAGVTGIRLKDDDEVVSAEVVSEGDDLITITTKGFGKRTVISDYRLTNRGAKGVISQICNNKTGKVVSVLKVHEKNDLFVVTKKGIIIKIPANTIHISGRNTQGVRIIKLNKKDSVVSIETVDKDSEPEEE